MEWAFTEFADTASETSRTSNANDATDIIHWFNGTGPFGGMLYVLSSEENCNIKKTEKSLEILSSGWQEFCYCIHIFTLNWLFTLMVHYVTFNY